MEMIDDIDIQNQFSDNGWAQIGAIGGDSCIDRRQRDFEMKDWSKSVKISIVIFDLQTFLFW